MYFVISVFPISMTSGALPPASVASNFAEVRTPRLVLDIDVPARVLGLELGVRSRHDLRPAGLRVDLEPDGQGVGGPPTRRSRCTDSYDCERGNERSCGENTYVHSHLPRHSSARPGRVRTVWQRTTRALKWFVPICHGPEASTSRAVCQGSSCARLRRQLACSEAMRWLACGRELLGTNHAGRADCRRRRRRLSVAPATLRRNRQRGDEAVPIAAVDRLDELDDLAASGSA